MSAPFRTPTVASVVFTSADVAEATRALKAGEISSLAGLPDEPRAPGGMWKSAADQAADINAYFNREG